MPVRLLAWLLVIFWFLASPGITSGQHEPKLTLHAQMSSGGTVCGDVGVTFTTACSQFVTNLPTQVSANVYLVAAQVDSARGVGGLGSRVLYGGEPGVGIDVIDWILCADLEFSVNGWPDSGAANMVSWAFLTNCQRTVLGTDQAHAVAGVFYVYAYSDDMMWFQGGDVLERTHPWISDCQRTVFDVRKEHTGSVSFGTGYGCNPCVTSCAEQVPVNRTTWGSTKTLFATQP